jgi:hypothetical protein
VEVAGDAVASDGLLFENLFDAFAVEAIEHDSDHGKKDNQAPGYGGRGSGVIPDEEHVEEEQAVDSIFHNQRRLLVKLQRSVGDENGQSMNCILKRRKAKNGIGELPR